MRSDIGELAPEKGPPAAPPPAATPPADMDACRKRAGEVADLLKAALRVKTPGPRLLEMLIGRLEELVKALQALGASAEERESLEKLLAGLRATLAAGSPGDQEAERAFREAIQVLEEFAGGRREGFWK